MRKYKSVFLLIALMVLLGISNTEKVSAQDKLSYDTTYTFAHYKVRRAFYEGLPNGKHEIVFLGNSITENGDWNEIFRNKNIVNRGIGGDVCFGLLNRLDEVLDSKPESIFLMIGINDIGRSVPVDVIASKIKEIVMKIKNQSPKTMLYLQSVLPINEKIIWYPYMKGKSDKIVLLNGQLKSIATNVGIPYLDLYTRFADSEGQLIPEYTADGIHLSAAGYLHWRDVFKEEKIRF